MNVVKFTAAIELLQEALDSGELQESEREAKWGNPTYDTMVIGDPHFKYRFKPKVRESRKGWVLPAHLHQNNPDCHNDECILVREVLHD